MKRDYQSAMHAMQAGVQMKLELHIGHECEPKHLRVGVNAAMRDHASLVQLLIKKGVITEAEYLEAMVDGANEEAEMYERELSNALGKKVTLI